jgi:Family of unknown function (DUF5317)
MLLAVPVFVAIIVALAFGGSLRNLAVLPIRGAGFLLGSLAIQLALYAPLVRDSAFTVYWGGAIYIAALVLVLLGALRNWRLGFAVRLAILGLALNTVVIVCNGGHMPVDSAAMAAVQGSAKVQEIREQHLYGNTGLATGSSRLTPLSDILPVRLPHGPGNVYSIGDALLTLGIAAATYRATRQPFVC